MGTPEIAAVSLAELNKCFEITAVISQPDKPKGRNWESVMPTPVKAEALKSGIPVYQPAKIRDGEAERLLRELAPDLIVLVAYGKILPEEILNIPPLGCVNLHGSLLPEYRGAAPIERAVVNGEKITGVTTIFMSAGIDDGDMIYAEKIEIGENETGGELRERLGIIGARLLVKTVGDVLNGTAKRIQQDHAAATYASIPEKSEGRIDAKKSSAQTHDLIRGFTPAPGAFCFVDGKRLKILKTLNHPDMNGEPGIVSVEDRRLFLYCAEGAVELVRVLYEGKKETSGYEFYNGHKFSKID